MLRHIFVFFKDFSVILLSGVLIASLVKFLINKRRFLELAVKLPGPPAYPLIGNALKFACKSDELLERIVSILEPYADVTPMRLWMGPELYVVITEPRDIEVVLNSQQAMVKGKVYKFFYPFIGNGLISGSGKVWRAHRKIISHIVNQRTLDAFVETFDRCSKELVEKLKPLANGEEFDIFHYIEGSTIDIVCETVMGYTDANALNNPNREFIYHTAQMYKTVYDRMMKIWLYPDWIFQMTPSYRRQQLAKRAINEFTERCIEARRREIRDADFGTSILHKLLLANDATKELNAQDLRDEIYTIYIASQDTLASICSFAVLMLGIHESVQDKARAEVREVLGEHGEINAESLSRLKYVEMVIKETLRLFPIAPLMVRRLSGELKLEKYVLPEDCHVVIAAYGTHRSRRYWQRPDEFIPERFAAEETSKRHPYVFVPFSGGPMGCIGKKYAIMTLKTILVHILQNYAIKSTVALNKIKLKTDISIRSVNGYKVSLELRDNTKI